MIGFACSSESDGSCINAKITVLHTQSFELQNECVREVYTYNRFKNTYDKVYPPNDTGFGIHYDSLVKIFKLLHIEEIKWGEARVISWKLNSFSDIEIVDSKPLENVWLPLPVITEKCEKTCINVTDVFFDHTPKPLEVSMLCDLFNLALLKSECSVANPFYHCYNSVYCNVDFAYILKSVCGLNMIEDETVCPKSSFWKYKNHIGRLKRKRILDLLRTQDIPKPRFAGSEQSFAVDLKRECVLYTYEAFADAVLSCTPGPLIGFSKFISTEINRFKTVSEVFVIGNNLYKTSDILYLTLYELMLSLGDFEERLELKKKVAHSKRRQANLNKLKTPRFIFADAHVL